VTETARVANFRTRLEAELAGQLLDALDIPYVINSAEGMAYGPLGLGATIIVRAEHADLAREALTAAQGGDIAPPHVVRLGPPLPERMAEELIAALRRAGLSPLARSSVGGDTAAREVSVFVRSDQAEDARRVVEHLRGKAR
jgi:hypothetical protein